MVILTIILLILIGISRAKAEQEEQEFINRRLEFEEKHKKQMQELNDICNLRPEEVEEVNKMIKLMNEEWEALQASE